MGVLRVWMARDDLVSDQMEIDDYDSQLFRPEKRLTRVVREGDKSDIASAWNMKLIVQMVWLMTVQSLPMVLHPHGAILLPYGQDSEIFSLPPQLSSRASDF
ncbi:hypothetical protein F2Q68_00042445 [Brassica cretica]|uniref:Uncharacterized protein n=1 Tax=Brassica cretica TaxID=69181 RepID=A0A8S9MM98_BRACR|nr:hypothetical protein F2Q68_00042445 [Brassica cretica]